MGADPAALESIRQTFLTANSSIFLLAGIERLLTMVFHTAMSLLVCYSVARHRLLPGLLICLGLHTLVDCTAGLSLVLPQAGIERLLTMVFHTAMSLLVCYSVARHRLLPGLLICLGLHTLVDCTAGLSLVLPQTTAMVIIYTLLTIMALLSLWIIRTIHRRWASEGERLC